jgi:hypothetical protein
MPPGDGPVAAPLQRLSPSARVHQEDSGGLRQAANPTSFSAAAVTRLRGVPLPILTLTFNGCLPETLACPPETAARFLARMTACRCSALSSPTARQTASGVDASPLHCHDVVSLQQLLHPVSRASLPSDLNQLLRVVAG